MSARRSRSKKKSAPRKETGPKGADQNSPPSQKAAGTKKGKRSRRGGGSSRRPRSQRESPVSIFKKGVKDYPPPFEKLEQFLRACSKLNPEQIEHTPEEFTYFVASSVETLAEDELEKIYHQDFSDRFQKLREENEIPEDKFWDAEDPSAPEPYRNLLHEFRNRKREVLGEKFEGLSFPELAKLVREDYDEYRRRKKEGQRSFFARFELNAVSFPIPEEAEQETVSSDLPHSS